MPIDIHGLQKRYESMPGLDLPPVRESVKEFRATLQGRKKELLEPFGLDNLDKFKDDPDAFVKMVGYASNSFKGQKEQNALYKTLYRDEHCLVTYTNRSEGAAAAGSQLKVEGVSRCPWCICVKHPDNEKWWMEYKAAALTFIYAGDDACCILMTPSDAISTLDGKFSYSQVEGIENSGLKGNPERQREVLERLYGKTGLSDSRLVDFLEPVLKNARGELEKADASFELIEAVKAGKTKRVKAYLAAGANVNDLPGCGGNILLLAVRTSGVKICKLLINAGADVNARDGDGLTPLFLAASGRDREICKLLLDAGADVNAQDKYGYTPLFRAASRGDIECVKVLIDAGADTNARDNCKRTPLRWSVCYGHIETCKLLIDAGADVNVKYADDWSPLFSATLQGNIELCDLLIDAGADVNARDNIGQTPLDVAKRWGCNAVYNLLKRAGARG